MKRAMACMVILSAIALVGTAWAGKDREEPQVRLEVDLVDGSHIIGTPGIESVPVRTSYAKMDIALKQIRAIKIAEDHENASIDLRNGDKLKGVITLGPIKLETAFGTVKIGIEHIRTLDVVLVGGGLPDSLRKGLLVYYSFDKDAGGNVADESGKKNNGEAKGAKWTAKGKIGGAYQVGKGLGHIQTPNQEAWSFGTKPFSICFWFKFNALPVGEQMFIGHDDGGGERNKWAFELLNGSLGFHINNRSSESYRIAVSPWSPQLDRYYHLSVTRSGNTYSIYVDGVRVATDTNKLPLPVANAPLTIGQAEGLHVEGIIDEVLIFDRALSDDEARQIYDAQK